MPQPYPSRIETDRLVLRPPRPEDAAALFAAYTQDAQVCRYMVWKPHAALSETQDFVAYCIEGWQRGSALPYVLTRRTADASDEPIGMLEGRVSAHTVNVGYVLARSHWGHGLMPEALRAFARLALSRDEVFRVEASCDVDNRPSARMLEKSGFTLEGRLARHTVHPNLSNEPRSCFLYAVCR
ncbi:GNAT family N-acetyltransferase [Acidovorax cavernicola]|uniref:N-acetyltransferase n=1 Tax=Acidovorax cavernicola TaxID=1675792 RepID=A0A9X8D1Q7_9BURK|nr:GNAT family protein [Acidovorax cavernicola]RIX76434.1 N-acetyltransferase [Acidovorax cavernicola]